MTLDGAMKMFGKIDFLSFLEESAECLDDIVCDKISIKMLNHITSALSTFMTPAYHFTLLLIGAMSSIL